MAPHCTGFEASVIVTNYHLLFAHLQVREATGEDLVLPPFDIAILDDAHKAADIARDFFGFRVTAGAVRWVGRLLSKAGSAKLADRLAAETDRFFDRLLAFRRSTAYKTRLRQPNPVAVASTFAEIIDLARGRTLGLFTSYRNLNATYQRVAGNGHRVLKQGDMPRTALIEEFRRDVGSVLLGTESFWAGVDVPGESLSCVVIDRLPFPTPDDPVLDAITQCDSRWFTNYSVPRAVIAFKQGFGRLIRTVTDRGVVVVLDRRLVTKPYGRLFTESLPDVLESRPLDSSRRFPEAA